VTPQSQARYSFLLGGQVLPDQHLVIGGAARRPELPFIGPLWAQVELAPNLSDPLKSNVVFLLRKDW
jgi:hypothetical protein